jgi:hypothetical protein
MYVNSYVYMYTSSYWKVMAEWLAVLLCIPEVRGLNLESKTVYSEWGFGGLPQSCGQMPGL